MRLKIGRSGNGLHPSEVVVSVKTADGGIAELVVHKHSVCDDSLEIGYPISESPDSYLVELPRETTTGAWRLWVPIEAVSPAT